MGLPPFKLVGELNWKKKSRKERKGTRLSCCIQFFLFIHPWREQCGVGYFSRLSVMIQHCDLTPPSCMRSGTPVGAHPTVSAIDVAFYF